MRPRARYKEYTAMTTVTMTTFYMLDTRSGLPTFEASIEQVAYMMQYRDATLVEVFHAASHGDAQRYVETRGRERRKEIKPRTRAGVEDALREASERLAAYAERDNELRGYLQSEKFHCGNDLDGYVSVADVLARLGLV